MNLKSELERKLDLVVENLFRGCCDEMIRLFVNKYLVVWAIATRGIYESLAFFICYYFVRMYYFSWDKFRANDSVYFCLSFFLHFRIDCHRHEQCLYG